MQSKYCWRLTDNRHWDSPARMSDGRIFTDWRSSCRINNDIAKRAGLPRSMIQTYSEMLQTTHGAQTERAFAESKVVTGDSWGRAYSPPPARQLIVPEKRSGVEIMEQDITRAIAAEVLSGNTHTTEDDRFGRLSQGNVNVSDCGIPAMSRSDPRWGLSPETMVFNLRNASAGGDNPVNWIYNSERN